MKTILTLIAVWFVLPAIGSVAQDYQGADAVLKQIATATEKTSASKKVRPDAAWNLRQDLKAFRNAAAAMLPEQAAREWLALLDRTVLLSHAPDAAKDSARVYIQETYLAVPPPAAWDALAREINARPVPAVGPEVFPAQALRVLAAMLQGRFDDVRRGIDALGKEADRPEEIKKERSTTERAHAFSEALLGEGGTAAERKKAMREAWFGVNARELVQRMRKTAPSPPQDAASQVRDFEQKLAALHPPADKQNPTPADKAQKDDLPSVPDLVPVLGAERAEAILRKVFVAPVKIGFDCDPQTEALARRLALEMADKLTFAPWALAQTFDSVNLYLALAKRFPAKADDFDWDQENAVGYALVGLAGKGRLDEAEQLALQMGEDAAKRGKRLERYLSHSILRKAVGEGHGGPCFALLDRLLRAHPALPAWDSYLLLARLTGNLAPALDLMKTAVERADRIKGKAGLLLRDEYACGLLAADRAAEGAAILRDLALSDPPEGGKEALSSNGKEHRKRLTALAQLASLLDDKALLNQTLDALVKQDAAADETLIPLFLAAGRGPEMESVLAKWLAQGAADYAEGKMADNPVYNRLISDRVSDPALSLVEFYDAAGRPQDIVKLFDRGQFWPVNDVAEVISRLPGGGGDFGYQAAHALAEAGRLEPAVRTLDAFLDFHSNHEDAYALLLQLQPPEVAVARLGELFARDSLDGQPMAWRARALIGLGRFDEAAQSARRAIAVSPFDEDPTGARAHAWSELADALARQGNDPAVADATRRQADAIGQLVLADKLEEAGLFTRAAAAYQRAHDTFGDDYGVEWKLAQALSEIGRFDEAATRFRHACELMPTQFVHRSARWWDSNKIMDDARMQAIAEEVLAPLAAAGSGGSQPDNPRVHFALGLLRDAQDCQVESLAEMRAAVRLDPDFFDAWVRMPVAYAQDQEASHERRANLLRLSPQARHGVIMLFDEDNLRALWQMVAEADKFFPRSPADLYPFSASRVKNQEEAWAPEQRDFTRKDLRAEGMMDPAFAYGPRLGGCIAGTELFTPAAAVMSNYTVALTAQFLGVDSSCIHAGSLYDDVQNFPKGRAGD